MTIKKIISKAAAAVSIANLDKCGNFAAVLDIQQQSFFSIVLLILISRNGGSSSKK